MDRDLFEVIHDVMVKVTSCDMTDIDEDAEITDILPQLTKHEAQDLMLVICLQRMYPEADFLYAQLVG